MTKRPIPVLRERLLEIAAELTLIVEELKREPYARPKGRPKSARMTKALAQEIRFAASRDRSLSNMDLAKMFNVNIGRVSEALNHRW